MGKSTDRSWRQDHPPMNDDIKDTRTIVIDFDRGIHDFKHTAKQIQNLLKTGRCTLDEDEFDYELGPVFCCRRRNHDTFGYIHNVYDFSQVTTLMITQNYSSGATGMDFLRFVSAIFQTTQIVQMSFGDYQTSFWSELDGYDIFACVPPNHTFLLRKSIDFEGVQSEEREHRGVDYPQWMHNYNMGGKTPQQGRCMIRVRDLFNTTYNRQIRGDYQTITAREMTCCDLLR